MSKPSSSAARRLLIIGAGGHARVVAHIASLQSSLAVVGCADLQPGSLGERVGATSVVGVWGDRDAWLPSLRIDVVALAIGDNALRRSILDAVLSSGVEVVTLIHPTAIVASDVTIGVGSVVCAGAILCTEVVVGANAIINTGAIVDHECRLEDDCHVAPGVKLAGRVRVGAGAFIGIGTSVRDKITIGKHAVIGAGSVVVSDIPENVVAFGCPARVRPVDDVVVR